ncbi:MAG: hypothetical protein Q8L60_06505 [Gammaproteobacteria bacterium]|nr:hypothetical protein [Gammaproteobacteria bacterium]MDP2142049.1 hypothetical protein [Gammaproteobacteria bacterium]MDP2348372.1 hypothetical protein [Gammaproteobacteria bacterium]
MKMNIRTVVGLLLGMTLVAASMMPAQAQPTPPPRPLSLNTPTGLPVLPIMEGSYDNEDGSFTVSFGYHNRNTDQTLDIPIGPNNFLEPEQFNGMQPTHFATGRSVGVFTVTVPASMRDQSIWWNIKTGNGEMLRVPGRIGRLGYTLDKKPRPAGTVAPLVGFTANGPRGQDPMGIIADAPLTVAAGSPLTLTVHAEDISVRDTTDPRYVEPVPVMVTWQAHQGAAANVTFTRHESTPAPTTPVEGARRPRGAQANDPNQVRLPLGHGVASVVATFSVPGEYIIRAAVTNHDAADSSYGDQCCWTNAYHKVTVTP